MFVSDPLRFGSAPIKMVSDFEPIRMDECLNCAFQHLHASTIIYLTWPWVISNFYHCKRGLSAQHPMIRRKFRSISSSISVRKVICRPLDWGADMVIQSLTKYYEGHNIMTVGPDDSAWRELSISVNGHIITTIHFGDLWRVLVYKKRGSYCSLMYIYNISIYTCTTLDNYIHI